jgi:predicted metal-dependent phosphotriesterase family hydrolase
MPKSVPFEQVLSNYLKDPEKAMSYLKSALEENDPELFQAALQDVMNVHQAGMPMTLTLPRLVDSLKRHGVDEAVIQSVITDVGLSAA